MLLSERVNNHLFENKDTTGIKPAKCCNNCSFWGGISGKWGMGVCKAWTLSTSYPVMTKPTEGCKKFDMRK